MQEIIKLLIGAGILILGWPIGNFLASKTKEELPKGQRWFRLVIAISLIGAIISLILLNDILLFSFCFIAVVTSRSLLKK